MDRRLCCTTANLAFLLEALSDTLQEALALQLVPVEVAHDESAIALGGHPHEAYR